MPKSSLKAGLFGRPLSRSLSPEVFRAFAALTGLDISYELRDVSPAELRHGIEAARAEGWAGFNVTIPYKTAVCPLLSLTDPAAAACGAVNCVRFGRTGLEGLNTDARALREALQEKGFEAAGRRAAVYGAGGSAAAAGWALGRSRAAAVVFHARNAAAAGALAARLADAFPRTVYSAAPFAAPAPDAEILVNATPLGMYGPGRPPCEPRAGQFCADLPYAPGGTAFSAAAAAAGAVTADGLDLLVWQAALALRHWTGLPAGDIVEFKREAAALLRRGLKGGD